MSLHHGDCLDVMAAMEPESVDELERLAKAATPGPWVAQSRDNGRSEPWYIDTHASADGPEPVWAPPQYPVSEPDAAYIAAANPATVRRLIAEVRRLRAIETAARETVPIRVGHVRAVQSLADTLRERQP